MKHSCQACGALGVGPARLCAVCRSDRLLFLQPRADVRAPKREDERRIVLPEPKRPMPARELAKSAHTPRFDMDAWGWGSALPIGVTVILSAEAGAGKSTFLAKSLSTVQGKILYASSEESAYRLGERVMRIGASPELPIYHQKSIFEILRQAKEDRPDVLVIDSINACHGIDSGGQNVALNDRLDMVNQAVIEQKMTAILISHVNGEGEVYGPTTLEHMCDILMSIRIMRGGPLDEVRVIEGKKNRFGMTGRYGAFRHIENGLARTDDDIESLSEQRLDEGLSNR